MLRRLFLPLRMSEVAATETFVGTPGMSHCGRLSPLLTSLTIGVYGYAERQVTGRTQKFGLFKFPCNRSPDGVERNPGSFPDSTLFHPGYSLFLAGCTRKDACCSS